MTIALLLATIVALVAAPAAGAASVADASDDGTNRQLLGTPQDLTDDETVTTATGDDETTGSNVTDDGSSETDGTATNGTITDASVSVDGDASVDTNETDAGNGTDASLATNGSADADGTVDRVNDTVARNGIDGHSGATSGQGNLSVEAGDRLAIDGSLEANASTDGTLNGSANVGVDLGNGSSTATIDANVGVGGESDGGGTGETDPNGTDGGGATDGRDGEGGPGGENAQDGDSGPSGDDGLPSPEDAGTGVAIGSLLVGGGLLGSRFIETSAVAGGSGAGGSLLTTAITVVRTWGWRVLGLAGYHRLRDSEPLDHETRAEIYERIDDEPGVFLTELSEGSDVHMSTLRYHLRVLEYEELIRSEKVRGKRRYVPADVDPDALGSALADDATAAVLEAVAEEPGSVSGLADRLDRDPSTVTHHLQRLDDDGLVERERDGRAVVTKLADGVDPTEVRAATASGAD